MKLLEVTAIWQTDGEVNVRSLGELEDFKDRRKEKE